MAFPPVRVLPLHMATNNSDVRAALTGRQQKTPRGGVAFFVGLRVGIAVNGAVGIAAVVSGRDRAGPFLAPIFAALPVVCPVPGEC